MTDVFQKERELWQGIQDAKKELARRDAERSIFMVNDYLPVLHKTFCTVWNEQDWGRPDTESFYPPDTPVGMAYYPSEGGCYQLLLPADMSEKRRTSDVQAAILIPDDDPDGKIGVTISLYDLVLRGWDPMEFLQELTDRFGRICEVQLWRNGTRIYMHELTPQMNANQEADSESAE